jgi:hypothetical protein
MIINDLENYFINKNFQFASCCRRYFSIAEGHAFVREYLRSRFPKLPSYKAYTRRITRLSEVFRAIAEELIGTFRPSACEQDVRPINSSPITTCEEKNRTPKVDTECVAKGYCVAKNLFFYGLRLHALNFKERKRRNLHFVATRASPAGTWRCAGNNFQFENIY